MKEIRHAVGVLSKAHYEKWELQRGSADDVYGHVPNRYACSSKQYEAQREISYCRFSNMGVNAADGGLSRVMELNRHAYEHLSEGKNLIIYNRTRGVVSLGLDICMVAWAAGCLREGILTKEALIKILGDVSTPETTSVGHVKRTEPGCAVNCAYHDVVKRAGLIKE